MHRDYSRASSYVAIAVFDDRIEVRGVGDFPTGIRAEMLAREHPSRRLLRRFVAEYYHRCRTHLSLGKDAPESRAVEPPEMGDVVELPLVGGLRHRYVRRAAWASPCWQIWLREQCARRAQFVWASGHCRKSPPSSRIREFYGR